MLLLASDVGPINILANGRVEWGKTHTFWKVGSVSQNSEDNDLISFPSGTSNICLQSIGETAP